MLRLSVLPARGCPVERIRKAPVAASIIVAWLPSRHWVAPFAGSSSIA